MRTILISLILAGIASAEVPSLINYQGRLTNADGEPLTGTKNFELKIFDAQTGGNLLYTEDVGAIQLGEGGVYSFQFGGKGTSNTQITETVGIGNGENLYQKILSNTPIVEGSVSVSDGTYTWSQESGSSNEDDFNAAFSTNLNRITVNYFADAPNDSRQIEVTYRYQADGIIGALSSGSGHWLQLSVDGETQATRERVLAVPFALRAGVAERVQSFPNTDGTLRYDQIQLDQRLNPGRRNHFILVPPITKAVRMIKVNSNNFNEEEHPIIKIRRIPRPDISAIDAYILSDKQDNLSIGPVEAYWQFALNPSNPEGEGVSFTHTINQHGRTIISVNFSKPLVLENNGQYLYAIYFEGHGTQSWLIYTLE